VNFLLRYPYADTRVIESRAVKSWRIYARIIKILNEIIYKLHQELKQNKVDPDSYTYPWDTPKHNWHNVRVLCDKANLTYQEKNIISACIYQESRFNNNVVHRNMDKKMNTISIDYGIVQVNDYWHIGIGKAFPSIQYVKDNPDKCVQWMINMYKVGKLKMWTSYSSGAYKKWLKKGSAMWTLAQKLRNNN